MVSLDEITRRKAVPQDPSLRTWHLHDLQDVLENSLPGAELPVLKIEVTDIKDRKAQFRDNAGESEPPPKKARTTFIHAQCLLTIWQCGSGNEAKLVEQTETCTLQARTKESGERIASVSMDQPFYVRLEQIQVKDQKGSRKLINQAYNVQITILVNNVSEPWPPFKLGLTPTPKVSVYEEAGGIVRAPVLVAKWHKFPKCPEKLSDSLLEATAYQDRTTYKPKLSFKIKAAWGLPPTPLEICNASLRSKSNSPPHLPSPISEADPKKPSIRIRWIFEGNWKHIDRLEFMDYICPLCDGMKFNSMDLFHFHLTQNHDLFTFGLNKVKFDNSDRGQQEIYAEVSVDANARHRVRGGSNAPDQRNMDYERPNTIFDLQKHLKEYQDQFVKGSRRTIHRPSSNPKESSRVASGADPRAEIPIPKASRRLEAVPDIATPDRKRFRVPPAPDGVKFFRLVSKRPLSEGEEISESDDDVDETWLVQKHSDIIKSFSDMSLTEKEFICRYDKHMLTENLSSHVHFREALVRFCRINRTWLRKPEMRREFHNNMAKLLLQGVIQIQLIGDCEKIIQREEKSIEAIDLGEDDSAVPHILSMPSDHASSQPEQPRRSSKEKSKSPTEPFHTYGTCVCGVKLYKIRDLIRCANIDCENPSQHLSCAGLEGRVSGWICAKCRPQLPKPSFTKAAKKTSATFPTSQRPLFSPPRVSSGISPKSTSRSSPQSISRPDQKASLQSVRSPTLSPTAHHNNSHHHRRISHDNLRPSSKGSQSNQKALKPFPPDTSSESLLDRFGETEEEVSKPYPSSFRRPAILRLWKPSPSEAEYSPTRRSLDIQSIQTPNPAAGISLQPKTRSST